MHFFSSLELQEIGGVLIPWLNRQGDKSGFDSNKRAAIEMLKRWDADHNPRNLSRSEVRGLHELLTGVLGDVRPPSGLRKGLASFGIIGSNGEKLYQVRLKLESLI